MLRSTFAVFCAALATALLAPPTHGQWTEAPGTGWVDVQFAYQRTQEGFNKNGNVVPLDELDPDARSTVTTLRLSGALGLIRGVDVWGEFPFHRQTFEGTGSDLLTTGLGDVRTFLRVSPLLFGISDLPVAVALRGGVKLSTGGFVNDAETISLSQGQRDWEAVLEVGSSLPPEDMYVAGWTGFRWREENEEIRRDPGNEWLFHFAIGGAIDRFEWKAAVDGLFGNESVGTLTGFEFAARELVEVTPTVGWQIGPGSVEAGVRIPVHGQSTRSDRLPSSPTVTVGYLLDWDTPLWR